MMESCYDSAVKCGNKIQFAINELLQKKVSKQKLGCLADGGYIFFFALSRTYCRTIHESGFNASLLLYCIKLSCSLTLIWIVKLSTERIQPHF